LAAVALAGEYIRRAGFVFVAACLGGVAAQALLFCKKEAKTFAYLAYALGHRDRLTNKSFLVLFLKKELHPCFVQPHLWSRSGISQTQGNLVWRLGRVRGIWRAPFGAKAFCFDFSARPRP
jgi:hypothetical protein